MPSNINVIDFGSIQAVAWIPYFKDLKNVTSNGYITYANEGKRKRKACDFLFYSGNEPSPEKQLGNDCKDFDKLLNSKNYRGALGIYNLSLDFTKKTKYRINCKFLKHKRCIGFTPYRNPFRRSRLVISFQRGVGGNGSRRTIYHYVPDGVDFTHTIEFRIGHIGNLFAKILTGHFAPKAWMRFHAVLKDTGDYTMDICGSHIPNQIWYKSKILDFNKQYFHDMMKNEVDQVKSFFEADLPFGKTADGNYFYQFSGKL